LLALAGHPPSSAFGRRGEEGGWGQTLGKGCASRLSKSPKGTEIKDGQFSATSDIYAPFRTYANFSPENFNLKDINSLTAFGENVSALYVTPDPNPCPLRGLRAASLRKGSEEGVPAALRPKPPEGWQGQGESEELTKGQEGKKKLFKLFQDYKKASFSVLSISDSKNRAPLWSASQATSANLSQPPSELLALAGHPPSGGEEGRRGLGQALAKANPEGVRVADPDGTSAYPFPVPLRGKKGDWVDKVKSWNEMINKKKYIWKLLLESLSLAYFPLPSKEAASQPLTLLTPSGLGKGLLALPPLPVTPDPNPEGVRKGSEEGGHRQALTKGENVPFGKREGAALPTLKEGQRQLGREIFYKQDASSFTNSTNKVLSQRSLRRAYSLDLYNSSDFSFPFTPSRLGGGDRQGQGLTDLAPNPEGVKGLGRKSPEFRDYYRKQTERTLIEEESKKVFVIINSFGGSVGNGVTVHDALQFIKAGSLTLALGVAASAASLALAGGTIGERYVTEGCHVMIHQPESSLQGQASDIWIDSQEIMKIRLDVAEIYSLSTYRPRHKILRDLDRDFYLSATETIQYGLADEIATNEIMTEIVEMTSKVWNYHDTKQQQLLTTREHSLQNTPETEESI
jgi:ATP-dependent Clp protease protease subunit